ncbi:MAG: oxaloacetate decarboxylase gamma subunit [Motiliproteus sp.]
MESNNLINEGLNLMMFGMGFVFVFLTLLVFVTGFMSHLVTRYLPEPAPVAAKSRRQAAAPASGTDDKQLVAVISAAIKKHRSR